MPVWTLAKKEIRLLLRDRLAALILLGLPFLAILLLGILLGEGFGQKPDDRLRVSLVDLDRGYLHPASAAREAAAWPALDPGRSPWPALGLAAAARLERFPGEPWSQVVLRDLEETAGIRVEVIPSRAEAARLCARGKRSAVLVFGPDFSRQVDSASFLKDGINPFYRDGVKLDELDVEFLKDETQLAAASIIEQVAQVTLLRVVLPWMIGKAFEKISEKDFIELLGSEVRLPVPRGDNFLEQKVIDAKFRLKGIQVVDGKVTLNEALRVAAPDREAEDDYRRRVGDGVQTALRQQFIKYNLTGKTWAALTRSVPRTGGGAGAEAYAPEGGLALNRGAVRYQLLVPSYSVMFAFALALPVGWMFVGERRSGTLKRLRAAPLSPAQLLLGKLLPYLLLSLLQGVVLFLLGKLVFGMRWGPADWPVARQLLTLAPVLLTTSLAAMGLALLIATVARSEIQVAIGGMILVFGLGLLSGCLIPRGLMPEWVREVSLAAPHAWALDAYAQLLLSPTPERDVVAASCLALTGFAGAFVGVSWWLLRRE